MDIADVGIAQVSHQQNEFLARHEDVHNHLHPETVLITCRLDCSTDPYTIDFHHFILIVLEKLSFLFHLIRYKHQTAKLRLGNEHVSPDHVVALEGTYDRTAHRIIIGKSHPYESFEFAQIHVNLTFLAQSLELDRFHF